MAADIPLPTPPESCRDLISCSSATRVDPLDFLGPTKGPGGEGRLPFPDGDYRKKCGSGFPASQACCAGTSPGAYNL
jgi:hypothetical protein